MIAECNPGSIQTEVNLTRNSKTLDLCGVDPVLHKMALEALEEGDALRLIGLVSNRHRLSFVQVNRHALKVRGIYEPALVEAYTITDSIFPLLTLEFLFKCADREKLRAAGNPVPGDSFTLYRGVSGVAPNRKVSGMSWTSSLEKAIWFAKWKNQPNPTVYQTVASADEVFWYMNERAEEEFILRAKKYRKLNVLCS